MRYKIASLACLLLAAMLLSNVAMAGYTYYDTSTLSRTDSKRLTPQGDTVTDLDLTDQASVTEAMQAALNRSMSIDNYTGSADDLNLSPDSGEVRILRSGQKVNLNKFVSALIPIKNMDITQARELRPIARAICAMEGGTAELIRDKVKGQYWIHVTCPPFQLPFVEKAILALDKPWLNATDDGSESVLYRAKYRDVRSVDRMARWYRGGASVVHDMDNAVTNVSDSSGEYVKYATMFDIPANEITIDAKFYETDTINDLKMGLDYIAWKNGPGSDLFDFGLTKLRTYYKGDGVPSIRTVDRGDYFSLSGYVTAAYYDFLRVKGKAKLLASPCVQVISGNFATWKAADPVMTITRSSQGGEYRESAAIPQWYDEMPVSPAGFNLNPNPADWKTDVFPNYNVNGVQSNWDRFVNYSRNAGRGEVGMFLNVFPVVGTESTEMYVGATVSAVEGLTPQGLPMISESSVVSQVRVRDGEQLILAGLTKAEKVKAKNGMPFLGDLPVLGYIFSGETTSNVVKDIVVTLEVKTSIGIANGRPVSQAMSAEMADVKSAAMGGDLSMLSNAPGFDQWLIDPEKY